MALGSFRALARESSPDCEPHGEGALESTIAVESARAMSIRRDEGQDFQLTWFSSSCCAHGGGETCMADLRCMNWIGPF